MMQGVQYYAYRFAVATSTAAAKHAARMLAVETAL